MGAVIEAAGTSLRNPVNWHSISWGKVHRNVRRLQVRIVKALKEGKPGLVRALQYILIRSLAGRAQAVRRVTENKGKRTPGVDGELWQTPEKKSKGILKLKMKGYRASPLRRTYIPKSNGKKRPLGIPTMTDRAFQALWKSALEPIAESRGDRNSYGFRNGRSVADAIEQCFNCLAKKSSSKWILEADIRACFDKISHEWLIENVPMNKKVLSQWLKAGFMEEGIFHETDEGTPQGGIISPVLANIALDGLEEHLKKSFPQESKIHFIRYADDFVTPCNELAESEVLSCIKDFIGIRGLELSGEKTSMRHISEGFDFLGQNVRKYGEYDSKLLIKPSKKNIKNFLQKARGIVTKSPCAHPINLIWQLNPMIRGWANFHRHVVSKAAFHRVDSEITGAIWKWAGRRHPNKSKKWIKKRYFRMNEQGRDWCFFGRKGEKRATLFKAQDVDIKRHIKVRGEANPFDPEWEEYFEKRLDRKTAETLKGRKRVFRLWQEQNGICPVCKQKIADQTQWHKHHIKWKIYGGGNSNDNIVLLHPNCHRQVHSQKLTVDKPGLSKGL